MADGKPLPYFKLAHLPPATYDLFDLALVCTIPEEAVLDLVAEVNADRGEDPRLPVLTVGTDGRGHVTVKVER